MKPIVIRTHTRPLRVVKYNREGDIFFTAGDDGRISVYYSDSGERIGCIKTATAVSTMDVTEDSELIVAGYNTGEIIFWKTNGGEQLGLFKLGAMKIHLQYSLGGRYLLLATCPHGGGTLATSTLYVYDMNEIRADFERIERNNESNLDEKDMKLNVNPIYKSSIQGKRILHVQWGNLNKTIYLAYADGSVEIRDAETLESKLLEQVHTKEVRYFTFSQDFSLMITTSKDGTAKVLNPETLEVLKTFSAGRPINAAAVSPLYLAKQNQKFHVFIGGGQEARDVAMLDKGGFEILLFNFLYEEEIASISGHIGPVNALAIHPDGKSFISGAEDGFARLHHLDPEYFTEKFDQSEPTTPALAPCTLF